MKGKARKGTGARTSKTPAGGGEFQKSTSRPHGRLQIRHTLNSRGHTRLQLEATRDVSTTDESLQNPDRCSHAGAQAVD